MNRRNFLIKSAFLMAGSLIGLNSFSKAFAVCEKDKCSSFQPLISIIIDDIGYSISRARDFLNLNIPITFSVLPRLTNSYNLAVEIDGKGHEIMLHQPMEPYNSHLDPGPGALYVGYESDKIAGIVEKNISNIPFATGVNNHMGSRFTSCGKEISETLRVISNKDLFFIDSLTSGHSVAYKTARKLQMHAACRNIFLDNRLEDKYIQRQLHKLQIHSKIHGHAIGIGHPFPETARAIRRFISNYKHSSVSFVHISDLLPAFNNNTDYS